MEDRSANKRIILVAGIFGLFFVAVIVKAFLIQIVNSKKLVAIAENQIFRIREVYPYRKNIFDRSGAPLAMNIKTYSIFTIPKNNNSSKFNSYKKLARIVPVLSLFKIKKAIKGRTRYTWLARKIQLTDDQVGKIKKLKGIYAEAVPKRIYPNNELLAQTLGFVGVDNKGLAGLEYQFDEMLRGKPRITKYLRDAKGRAISYESDKIEGDASDVYLSIDKSLQAVAEKYLKEAVVEYNADSGGIGVIDSTTGEILAIANYPTFNPNKITSASAGNRKLAFVSDPIEPGSIFKALTVASALEHNIAKSDTSYYCEKGRLAVDGHTIKEADPKKLFEWLTVREILKYSSNVGTTKIAFDLTFPKLKETLTKFRIGKKTGVEIPGESRGIFVNKENVSALTLSNISFGQGVATTGIQMLAAYAAIANGGIYYKPTIIKQDSRPMGERIISKKTSKELTEMMREVVVDGTGKNARISYFDVAGKTGTAQRPDSRGGYSGHVPGFIGYPVNIDERFVIYVYVDNPKGAVYYGNSVAAPVFKKVAQHILYKNKNLKNFRIMAHQKEVKTDIVKERKAASLRVFKIGVVPKFVGLDKMSAEALASRSELTVAHRGMGVVVKQSLSPNSKCSKDQIVVLRYAPPVYE